MAHQLPPLSTLRTFEAAARHLSFKKAAEELHVTPAAVSQQIKTLESWLGLALFLRRSNALQLSEAGLVMYPKIRDGLHNFIAGIDAVRKGTDMSLNVVAPPMFATRWLVPRLARFAAAYPAVVIRISSAAETIDGAQNVPVLAERSDVRNEASEVMIRFGTGVYPGCQVEKIQTPEYVLVCSPGLLAGAKPLRTPKDLAQHILIHDESISVLEKRPSWLEWFNLAGVSNVDTERGPRFSNSILAMEAVLDGQGVALALRPQIEADLAIGRLVTPFEISLPSAYAYYLVTPNAIAGNSAVIAFRKWLLAEGG